MNYYYWRPDDELLIRCSTHAWDLLPFKNQAKRRLVMLTEPAIRLPAGTLESRKADMTSNAIKLNRSARLATCMVRVSRASTTKCPNVDNDCEYRVDKCHGTLIPRGKNGRVQHFAQIPGVKATNNSKSWNVAPKRSL
jgi:hypothetical protein